MADMIKRLKARAKKLRAVGRACSVEADRCEAAANCPGVEDAALHAKNAATWRGRSRTCWDAAQMLSDLEKAI